MINNKKIDGQVVTSVGVMKVGPHPTGYANFIVKTQGNKVVETIIGSPGDRYHVEEEFRKSAVRDIWDSVFE